MVKLIMGLKGSGKTKQLVDLVKKAVEEEHGNVVCIEKDKNLTYDIPYTARLIHAGEYNINTNALLRGFVLGLRAGNYDITHIFIDSLTKIVGGDCDHETEKFLAWLDNFALKNGLKFTITISDEESLASEGIRKYF